MNDATTSFPKNKIKVVLLEGVHDRAAELFRGESFDVRTEKGALDPAQLVEIAGDAHVLGVRSKTTVPAEAIAAMPRLLCLGCFCIGTNQVALDAARGVGLPVFNSPFGNTRSVAELVVSEVIALHRRLFERSAEMHRGHWRKSASGSHEVRGRTLGIIGYGHIGSQVSVLAEAIGMRVQFFDVAPKLPLGNAQRVDTLGELLATSDAVTLHVPATRETDRMIGADELSRMKPGSFLINNARGTVVDVPALAEALRSGHLAGAAVDVFPAEPASGAEPFESELLGLESVILTPHIGGSTVEAQAIIAAEVASKLIRFVNNGSTTGAVNVPEVDLPEQSRASALVGGRPPHRVLHFHRNVPRVLRQIHSIIGDLGVNVLGEYLQTDAEVGYVVLEVAPSDGETMRDALSSIPETIRCRVLF